MPKTESDPVMSWSVTCSVVQNWRARELSRGGSVVVVATEGAEEGIAGLLVVELVTSCLRSLELVVEMERTKSGGGAGVGEDMGDTEEVVVNLLLGEILSLPRRSCSAHVFASKVFLSESCC